MRLKKMDITGFKSFSEKATISFSPGISALVGPNGCGKSNVVDAIKWVMGEQSVKQLRGKTMEDVIFAGASGKPPLNLAEVTITLSNENGDAPEEYRDFPEIMLTRRLYRSGESAYLINRQPSRLKDIHNIFYGSGLGARSYAVIQQGNIGAITDAGPDERRLIIEEAAGVTRYKNQKKEAERKIDATHQNMVRVSDIISEVKRQMESLNRQAKKAHQYKTIQEEIRKYDIWLALSTHDDYTAKIEETKRVFRDLQDREVENVSRLQALDAQIEKIALARSRKKQQMEKIKTDTFETRRAIDRVENDLSHAKTDMERAKEEIASLEDSRKQLFDKNKNLHEEIARANQETARLSAEILNVRESLEKENAVFSDISSRFSARKERLRMEEDRLNALISSRNRIMDTLHHAETTKENVKRKLKRTDEEVAATRQTVSALEKKEDAFQEKADSLDMEKESVEKAMEEMKNHLSEISAQLKTQVRKTQEKEMEKNEVRSRYQALKKMEKSREWYSNGVKAVMDHLSAEVAEDPSLNIRLFAEILTPEPGWEGALQLVMGEALEYLLVKDRETANGFMDHLEEEKTGRCGFIPLDMQEDESASPLKTTLSPSRSLLSRVKVSPGYEPVAEALLGGIAIARTPEDVPALFQEGAEAVITKQGRMETGKGVLICGSMAHEDGIFTRKREINELETRLKELDSEVKNMEYAKESLEDEAMDLESRIHKQTKEMNQTKEELQQAQQSLFSITEELKHARIRMEALMESRDELAEEEEETESHKSRYQEEITSYDEQINEKKTIIRDLTQDRDELARAHEEISQKVVELKLSLTSLAAKEENEKNTLKRLKEFETDGSARLGSLDQDIERKKMRVEKTREHIMNLENQMHDLYTQFDDLKAVLEKEEQEYGEIEDDLKTHDKSVSEIRTRKEEVQQKIRILELEQSQRKIKLENIIRYLSETYHKSIQVLKNEFQGEWLREPREKMEEKLSRFKKQLSAMQDVNLGAIREFEELEKRHGFLCSQRDDLERATDELKKVIRKINRITQERFLTTFEQVNEKLAEVFPRLFDGGTGKLVLTEPEKPLESGVEFLVHPPGKKLTRLTLLSGGEKALSAIALIFSIFLIKPASFCIMDEIDAPLDEANVIRFNELLKIIGEKSQIIMITHKKRTMEFADILFGITMEKKGISKVVSVDFNEKNEDDDELVHKKAG